MADEMAAKQAGPIFAMSNRGRGKEVVRSGAPTISPAISIVAPMYNEEGGAVALVREIASALEGSAIEIIIVDDCSTDGTAALLVEEKKQTEVLRILRHGDNAGQSRAVRTGILAARAPIIATLDGDGQNDPADIKALWGQIMRDDAAETLAMVAGERHKRQDSAAKRWASRVANGIRSRALKDGAADTGCGLKVFYKEAYLRLPYFDHMHRYLPALMRREGFEVEFSGVNHRARAHGVSKYTNWGRLVVAFRDMLGVMWLNDRANQPNDISEL